MKRHATDDVDPVTHTLCGERLPERSALRIDNADPDCGRCLRVIKARLKLPESALPRDTKIPNDGGGRR